MTYLVLLRHGQSTYNQENTFTGQEDVPLSEKGIREAHEAAKELEKMPIDIAFTSTLKRAQDTLHIVLQAQDKMPQIIRDPTLNERHYGELQNMNKDVARERFGEEKVFMWRRSYDVRPPKGESLKDVYERAVPYFEKHILPLVLEGKTVLVVAHGNSLRAIIKYLDNISDEEIPNLELPTGKPIVYKLDGDTLVKEDHIHSFNRPVHWAEPKRRSITPKAGRL